MNVVGPRRLPCTHQRVVLNETTDPQRRMCGTCRRRYVVQLVPADYVTALTGHPIYRVEITEAVA